MNIIIWEKWNCGDYMGPEKMYRVCGQSKRDLEELYEKFLPVYNLEQEIPDFYERRIHSLNYDKKSQCEAIIVRFKEKGLSDDIVPWKENGIIGKYKLKDLQYRIIPEFFSPWEVMSIPMWLKFNYIPNKNISQSTIDCAWEKFVEKIDKIKLDSKKLGRDEYFQTTINFPNDVHKTKLIEGIPYNGFIKDSLFNLPKVYQNFIDNKKLPIFVEFLGNSKTNKSKFIQKSGFDEVLVNSMYFFNSPMDVVIGGRLLQHNSIGNVTIPTIEDLGEHLFKNLNLSQNNFTLNMFLDKSDIIGWENGEYVYEDKSYHIENIRIIENKDNYYEDAVAELELWANIYNIIIDFEIKNNNLCEYKELFDKIVFV
jgi:hypothetical protein